MMPGLTATICFKETDTCSCAHHRDMHDDGTGACRHVECGMHYRCYRFSGTSDFRPFAPGDRLRRAYSVTVEHVYGGDPEAVLDRVFRAANRVDGSDVEQVPDGERSLSVGDVVFFEAPVTGFAWSCEPMGWHVVKTGDVTRALEGSK